jgi:hypothetical protein
MDARKRRRVIIEDEDVDERDSEAGSNPDELQSQNSSDEEGEDLAEHWMEYVMTKACFNDNLFMVINL